MHLSLRIAIVSLLIFPLHRALAADSKLSVLIVDGMNNHDWPRNTRILRSILEGSGLFTVEVSTSPTNTASAEEWDRKTRRTGNLAEFLAASPLRGSKLKVHRVKDGPRKVEL